MTQQTEMFNKMDAQPETATPEGPAKPRLTGKAKREALTEFSALMRYRSENDESYEPPEGARRMIQWLLFEVKKAEAKKG